MQFTIETKEVSDLLNKCFLNSYAELSTAIKNTAVYGIRDIKDHTPVRTGRAKNSWRWKFENQLVAGVYSNTKYMEALDGGWKRTRPIKGDPILIFEVGKKVASKSSTTTLYKRYKNAMSSLKGKGLSPIQKQALAVKKSGVVITRQVNKPASFRGHNFIQPAAQRMEYKLHDEVCRAYERIMK